MDKKIILSVLIVALIGVVAASYQIHSGDNILNPLASVETEQSPVTEALTAPETNDEATKTAQEQQQAEAQAQAQQQAKADAEAKAKAEAQNQTTETNQTTAGSGSQEISSDSPITITTDSGSSSGSSSSDNSQNTVVVNASTNTPQEDNSQTTELSISEMESIIQAQLDQANLRIDTDNYKFLDGTYQLKAYYKDTNEFAGTFYIRPEDKSWYFIDKNGDTVGPDAPTV